VETFLYTCKSEGSISELSYSDNEKEVPVLVSTIFKCFSTYQ